MITQSIENATETLSIPNETTRILPTPHNIWLRIKSIKGVSTNIQRCPPTPRPPGQRPVLRTLLRR